MGQSLLRLAAASCLLLLVGCETDLERIFGGDDCCCHKTQGPHEVSMMSRDECKEDNYDEYRNENPDGIEDGDCVPKRNCDSASRRFRLELRPFSGEPRLAQVGPDLSACAVTCRDHPELCTYLEAPEDLSVSLRNLHRELQAAASVGSLAKAAIMRMFGQETDPCERSDLVVSDSGLSNEGSEECALTSSVGGGPGSEALATAEVVLPVRLEAEWFSWPTRLRFEDPEKRPRLEVAIGEEAILSGQVRQVDLEESMLLIETYDEDGGRACSGLVLTSQSRRRS